MPRRQVYGKRARAIYDPFAVFAASPQRTPGDLQEVKVLDITKELARLSFRDGMQHRKMQRGRTALGEMSPNEKMLLASPPRQVKGTRRIHRKIVVEDEDEDKNQRMEASRTGRPMGKSRPGSDQEHVPADRQDDIDDVPMFCDGHGYETEEEDQETAVLPTIAVHESVKAQEQSQLLAPPDTPSISILPPTPPAPDEYTEHCVGLLELSSHSMSAFSEWSNQLSSHFSITKIAEASFGEVYRLSLLEQMSGFSTSDESVFKIIALRPPDTKLPLDKRRRDAVLKKVENMSRPKDVANEVKLLQRMSVIPGFTNFRDVRVVKGRPTAPFVKAYKAYNTIQKARKKDLSNFADPAKKSSYPDDQLWAVIEMQDAGTDLEFLVETGQCNCMWWVWDVFWQVVLSLAKGEEGAEFEHRDLHLGNICVRDPTTSQGEIDTKRKLNFSGLETTIIDYTISRATMPEDEIAYHDLANDAGVFEGDSTEEYQYDIYRYMRGAVLTGDPYAEAPLPTSEDRTWEQYHPITNMIWLHFILYKLLEQVDWPSASKAPPRKQKTQNAEWKRANDLEHVLLRVQDLLDPGVLCENELRSASELVGLAIREGWIDVEDVVGGDGDGSGLVGHFEKLELQAQNTLDGDDEPALAAEAPARPKTLKKR